MNNIEVIPLTNRLEEQRFAAKFNILRKGINKQKGVEWQVVEVRRVSDGKVFQWSANLLFPDSKIAWDNMVKACKLQLERAGKGTPADIIVHSYPHKTKPKWEVFTFAPTAPEPVVIEANPILDMFGGK